MTEINVVQLNERLHNWMAQYGRELEQDIAYWMHKHAIGPTSDLVRSFANLKEEQRLLQIGVVGRVKAGKSSLLNALVFEGHPILPRAATPMTAALTTLTYGETFSAQVQFYDAADRANIEQNAARYRQRLREEEDRAADILRQRRYRNGQHVEDEQFWTDVDKTARRALQGEPALAAAHDQWQSICKCNLDLNSLDNLRTLEAVDATSLAEKLKDYVAAGGSYMPLTKSVDIFLPLPSLSDIRIIDTPGLNDPVQSREERTTVLLKDCDVVLIISPAGQLLNEQDIELMSRITQKEGVQELVLIASQVDNQLYGSDIRQPTLQGALDKITETLSTHMVDTLQRLKVQHPEIGGTFDGLIQNGSGKVLCTSGICHSLSARFNQQQGWDSGERKAWDNLQTYYPDFFTLDHTERCRANLDLLANTAGLRRVLENVRAQKDRIIEQRRKELIRAKSAALEAFRADLLAFTKAKHRQISDANIEDLQAQKRKLNSLKVDATYALDYMLHDCFNEFRRELEKELYTRLNLAYGTTSSEVDSAATEITKKIEVIGEGVLPRLSHLLYGGGKETRTYTEFKLKWLPVYNGLEKFADKLAMDLRTKSKELTRQFQKQLIQKSTEVARRHLKDEIDPALISDTNKGLVSNFKLPTFELNTNEIHKLKRSDTSPTLTGLEAEEYNEKALHCLSKLKDDADRMIRGFIKEIEDTLPSSYGEAFCLDIHKRITQLEKQTENILFTLDRFLRMAKELDAL